MKLKDKIKYYKKEILFFSITSLLFVLFLSPLYISATTSNYLIKVGTGQYAITVKEDTTVEDIIKVLGNPKLVTDSAFGGNAYTFYTDENYNNFLYIETTAEGKIVSYGSVDSTFEADKGSYGDDYMQYAYQRARMGGVFYPSKDKKVIAGLFYNVRAFNPNNVAETANFFVNEYNSNPIKYLKGLSQQSILMFNALAKKLGKDANLKFDEDFFYINEQLKEFGSSIRDSIDKMEKGPYSYRIKALDDVEVDSRYYVLNPLQFARYASESLVDFSEFKDKDIAVFDYDQGRKMLTLITINKNIYGNLNDVALTQEEEAKLSAGRYEYQQAITNLNKENGLYKINPIESPASKLLAGELKDSKKQGITDYVNAIRVAAGIRKVKVNEEAFNVAQHISVLSTYRWVNLNLDIEHNPKRPEGVDEAFYKIAVGWEGYMSENIGRNNMQADINKIDGTSMMHSINVFLDDRTEADGLFFSHRGKIINPLFTSFGYGVSTYMYANEFTDVMSTEEEFVGWPSKGITFVETLDERKFYWTAEFYNNYKVTDETTVEVKNLKNNKVWTFEEEENTGKNDSNRFIRFFRKEEKRVTFRDNTIEPVVGDIYQITLHNVQKESTGENTDYVYRTIFENAEVIDKEITSLKINVPQTITKDGNNYLASPGDEIKLNAIIDDNSRPEKLLKWSSSDNNVITVTQNGTIKVLKESSKPVTIKVVNEYSGLSSEVSFITASSITVNPTSVTLKVNQTKQLQVTKKGNGNVTFSSDNSNIASVNSEGLITGVSNGSTIIRVKFNDKEITVKVLVGNYLKGDLNRNNSIELEDVMAALLIVTGKKQADNIDIEIGDFDNNKIISTTDAFQILNIFVNNKK